MSKKFSTLLATFVLFLSITNLTFANDDKEKLAQVGKNFVQALNNKDQQALRRLIDFNALFMPTAQTMFKTQKDRNDFMRGATQNGPANILANLMQSISAEGTVVAYKKLLNDNGKLSPLIRIDLGDGGIEFLILKLETANHRVSDIYYASMGRLMSEQLTEAVAMLMPPSEGLLASLFPSYQLDRDLIDQFLKMAKLRQGGQFQEAYALINAMPEDIRNSRAMLHNAIQLSQNISDEEYKSVLDRLAQYHGDNEDLQFMLVDHYFFKQDFNAAQKSVDMLLEKFGQDAALLNLRASIAIAANKLEQAVSDAEQAIQIEPSFEDAHWSLVSALITSKNYQRVPELLDRIAATFGYEFTADNFENEVFYADFVNSDVFRQWVK